MTDLVDRLTTHRTLSGVPRRELEWLAEHGELRRFDRGDIALRKDEPIAEMFIQLSGRVSSTLDRSTGRRHEGHVAVDTRPGRTEFCVTLPIDREKNSRVAKSSSPAEAP